MDWIERLFHLAPDHGSGLSERIVLLITLVIFLAVLHKVSVRFTFANHASRRRVWLMMKGRPKSTTNLSSTTS